MAITLTFDGALNSILQGLFTGMGTGLATYLVLKRLERFEEKLTTRMLKRNGEDEKKKTMHEMPQQEHKEN